jgi:hypothetical protein
MKTFTAILAIVVPASMSLFACGESAGPDPPTTTNPPDEVKVAGIYLDRETLPLTAGASGTLVASIVPSSAVNQRVYWSSGNDDVATVDSGGKVTAVAQGSTRVTVTTDEGGRTASCTVTVAAGAIQVSGVTLDKTELSVEAECQATLTARVVPSGATNKTVRWSTSDATAVGVDNTGKVTGLRAGATAVITVTTDDGSKTDKCTVTVKEVDPANILRPSNFPDPVFFEFCNRNLAVWDTNKDGKLYANEARAVRTIDVANVYGTAIGSLDGIEYFTGLTYLNCSNNNLVSLDVSRNSALNELYCQNNIRLRSLDVSGFTALTILNCSSCSLDELDLTRCTRLVDLHCSGNELESIDLSKCTALTYLDLDRNSLRRLDLTANRALKGLILDNNKLTELNLTACVALASLDCYNNLLTALDVSQNRDLIYLSCDVNRIGTLDISQNRALESLVCNSNGITSIVIGAENERLKYIHSSSNSLSSTALNNVFEALPASGTIAIYDNPGTFTCDVTIARNKNWTVMIE